MPLAGPANINAVFQLCWITQMHVCVKEAGVKLGFSFSSPGHGFRSRSTGAYLAFLTAVLACLGAAAAVVSNEISLVGL